MFNLGMIEISDLLEKKEKKEIRHTLAVDDDLNSMIERAREMLGKRGAAELMRRSIKEGLAQLFKQTIEEQERAS